MCLEVAENNENTVGELTEIPPFQNVMRIVNFRLFQYFMQLVDVHRMLFFM